MPWEARRYFALTMEQPMSKAATLIDRSSRVEVCQASGTLPATVGPFVLDEAGVAQREEAYAATAADSYRFRLEAFQLDGPQPDPGAP